MNVFRTNKLSSKKTFSPKYCMFSLIITIIIKKIKLILLTKLIILKYSIVKILF
jgi:hypothetical protein